MVHKNLSRNSTLVGLVFRMGLVPTVVLGGVRGGSMVSTTKPTDEPLVYKHGVSVSVPVREAMFLAIVSVRNSVRVPNS